MILILISNITKVFTNAVCGYIVDQHYSYYRALDSLVGGKLDGNIQLKNTGVKQKSLQQSKLLISHGGCQRFYLYTT